MLFRSLAEAFPTRVGYYTKAGHPDLIAPLVAGKAFAGIGVDSRWDLASLLARPERPSFVQGNFDPAWLFLPPADLGRAIDQFIDPIRSLSEEQRRGWICGLGHGVLPGTPESAVRTFVARIREAFA